MVYVIIFTAALINTIVTITVFYLINSQLQVIEASVVEMLESLELIKLQLHGTEKKSKAISRSENLHSTRKQSLIEQAKSSLSGFHVEFFNDDLHFVIENKVDFWPTTGRWKCRESGVMGNSLKSVLSYLSKTGLGQC